MTGWLQYELKAAGDFISRAYRRMLQRGCNQRKIQHCDNTSLVNAQHLSLSHDDRDSDTH